MRRSLNTIAFLFITVSIIFSSIPNSAHAQVNIPDTNLKAAIEGIHGVTEPVVFGLFVLYYGVSIIYSKGKIC